MSDSLWSGYQALITNGAKEDLEVCARADRYAAALLAAFIREVSTDRGLLECMIDEGFSDDRVDSIARVRSLQVKRINAYRAKLISIRNWRLIFIVDRPSVRIGLFAVMPRADDYENNRSLWDRIEREFDDCGFTRY
jgi:hypothetical protein